jgi:hypothetical protein
VAATGSTLSFVSEAVVLSSLEVVGTVAISMYDLTVSTVVITGSRARLISDSGGVDWSNTTCVNGASFDLSVSTPSTFLVFGTWTARAGCTLSTSDQNVWLATTILNEGVVNLNAGVVTGLGSIVGTGAININSNSVKLAGGTPMNQLSGTIIMSPGTLNVELSPSGGLNISNLQWAGFGSSLINVGNDAGTLILNNCQWGPGNATITLSAGANLVVNGGNPSGSILAFGSVSALSIVGVVSPGSNLTIAGSARTLSGAITLRLVVLF